jgi:catalase
VWDEAQKIAGKDPDFNRRDLYEQIESGNFPEFELCVQIIPEEDEHKFAFDILDATKLWPEELVPLIKVGKMTLDRNPTDFFAETEQVAFHPGHLVAGIDLTNDPLLQGRLFSYVDTQLTRLGGPNFAEIPINRPHAPVSNNQRDGFMRQHIAKSKVNYFPNSRDNGQPKMAPEEENGYVHYPQQVSGYKVRARGEGFKDFYSQATLFWNSMTEVEKKHIVEAAWFELGKVEEMEIRKRMVRQFAHVDVNLSNQVAEGIGVDPLPQQEAMEIQNDLKSFRENLWKDRLILAESPALSMEKGANKNSIQGRKVAILVEQGTDTMPVKQIKAWLMENGAIGELVSSRLGMLKGNEEVKIDKTFSTAASVFYDAVFLPTGSASIDKLRSNGNALHFINEAYKHCKAIGVLGEAKKLLMFNNFVLEEGASHSDGSGVVFSEQLTDTFYSGFFSAIAQHRHWNRKSRDEVPA